MIWVIGIIGIILFIFFRFQSDLEKDNDDLQGQSLVEKFNAIVKILNHQAFDDKGVITTIDKRSFILYEIGRNQTIQFTYGTGSLTITWKYGLSPFRKEVVHEKRFSDVRNLSLPEQERIAATMIIEMSGLI